MSKHIVLIALMLSLAGNAVAGALLDFSERGVNLEHVVHHQDAGDHHHHDDGSFHNDDPDAAVDHWHAADGLVPACMSATPLDSLFALIPPRPAKLAAPCCPYPVLDRPLRPPRLLNHVAPETRLRV